MIPKLLAHPVHWHGALWRFEGKTSIFGVGFLLVFVWNGEKWLWNVWILHNCADYIWLWSWKNQGIFLSLFGSRMITELHDPAKLKPSWLWFGGDLLLEEPVSFEVIVLSILTKPHPWPHWQTDELCPKLSPWHSSTKLNWRYGKIPRNSIPPACAIPKLLPFRANSQDQSRKIFAITCIGLIRSCWKILAYFGGLLV